MGSTRVAFISDLHANLVALDAVFADIDRLGVDEIVCLGDIVDLGPQPRELLARLDEREVRCIQGNHDPLDEHPSHPALLDIETWTREQLDDASLRRLAERVIINVGSVGMPFARALLPGGGEPKILPWCEYAVVSCTKGVASFDLRRVPLDVPAFVASVRASSFPKPEAWVRHWAS
jgi:hypothetical protein